MKYLLHSEPGYYVDIVEDISNTSFSYIVLDLKQEHDIKNALKQKVTIRVVNNTITFIKDEAILRANLVSQRSLLYRELEPFLNLFYSDLIGLTDDNKLEVKAYYNELNFLPQKFDTSDNKQEFTFVVTTDTEYSGDEDVIIFKPIFIK